MKLIQLPYQVVFISKSFPQFSLILYKKLTLYKILVLKKIKPQAIKVTKLKTALNNIIWLKTNSCIARWVHLFRGTRKSQYFLHNLLFMLIFIINHIFKNIISIILMIVKQNNIKSCWYIHLQFKNCI